MKGIKARASLLKLKKEPSGLDSKRGSKAGVNTSTISEHSSNSTKKESKNVLDIKQKMGHHLSMKQSGPPAKYANSSHKAAKRKTDLKQATTSGFKSKDHEPIPEQPMHKEVSFKHEIKSPQLKPRKSVI
jgi:hypothetical protein